MKTSNYEIVENAIDALERMREDFQKIGVKDLRALLKKARGDDKDALYDALDSIEELEDLIDASLDSLDQIEEDED